MKWRGRRCKRSGRRYFRWDGPGEAGGTFTRADKRHAYADIAIGHLTAADLRQATEGHQAGFGADRGDPQDPAGHQGEMEDGVRRVAECQEQTPIRYRSRRAAGNASCRREALRKRGSLSPPRSSRDIVRRCSLSSGARACAVMSCAMYAPYAPPSSVRTIGSTDRTPNILAATPEWSVSKLRLS